MEKRVCPKCGSTYMVFTGKQGVFLCKDCDHKFAPPKEFTPLRIFLSYGRDEYAGYAEKLKKDLKDRGHEVWYDKERLIPGAPWDEYIRDGIDWVSQDRNRARFLFLMTPHSVRRPAMGDSAPVSVEYSYCYNELSQAMRRSIFVVPVMLVQCEIPHSIHHIQYIDITDSIPPEEKPGRYEAGYRRILIALEEKKIEPEGMHARLFNYLSPLPPDTDFDRYLRRFTGRQWVFDDIDRWLSDPEGSRIFWITGNPGVGKTAIAAYLCCNRHEISASHFCRHGHTQKSDPKKLVTSIAYHLASRFPEYQKKLNDLRLEEIVPESRNAGTLFENIVIQPLSGNFPHPGKTVLILIDAMDEATKGETNEIASFIARYFDRTPSWLRIITTSRPDPEVMIPLQNLDPYFLDCSKQENKDDIRLFIEREYGKYSPSGVIPTGTIEKIMEKSEGLFLYVEIVREELRSGRLSLKNVDKFPRGIGGTYFEFFERQFPADPAKQRSGGHNIEFYKEKCKPMIEVIAASREPLEVSFIASLFDWDEDEGFDIIEALGSLFPTSGIVGGTSPSRFPEDSPDAIMESPYKPLGEIRPFHLSVTEWLSDRQKSRHYRISARRGAKRLADYCWNEYKRWVESGYRRKTVAKSISSEEEKEKGKGKRIPYYPADISGYALAHLPSHLIETGRWDDLETVLTDLRYIEARCAEGMTYSLIADYKIALESFPEVQEEIRKKRQNDERIQRWIREIIGYSRKWNEARERNQEELGRLYERLKRATDNDERNWIRHEIDNIMPSDEDNPLPEIPQSVRPWTKEEIRQDTLKIKNDPKRIDRVRAFSQFVNSQGHALAKYATFHSFCIQGAYNYANSGPVANSAKKIIESEKKDIIFPRHDKNRPPYNPHPALLKIMEGHTNDVRCVSITPDGKRAVSGSGDETLRLWDMETGECLKVMEGHTDLVNSVSLTPDGKRAVSGSGSGKQDGSDNTVRVWNLETGECLKTLMGHTSMVNSVSITPDGRYAFSGSGDYCLRYLRDCTVRVWDLKNGECLKIMKGHRDRITSVSITPDGKNALSGSVDNTLRLWDLETGECLRIMEGHTSSVNSVSITPDGKNALSGSLDKTLRLWDLETGECLRIMEGHTDMVFSVSLTPDGKCAVSGSGSFGRRMDNTVRVWDMETGECLKIIKGHRYGGKSVSITPDGKREVPGSLDKTVHTWNIEKWEYTSIKCNIFGFISVSVTPDVKRAVSVDCGIMAFRGNPPVRVWKMETGECLRIMKGHTERVTCVSVTPDGKIAVSGSGDKTLRLWDIETGECLRIMKGHMGHVSNLSVNPNGKYAVSGSGNYSPDKSDKTIRVWDMETGECLKIMKEHKDQVNSVSVTPDGKYALSGSGNIIGGSDNTVRVWDLETGECLRRMEGHTSLVNSVSVTPDGKCAVSGSGDKTLRLWDLQTGECVAIIEIGSSVGSISNIYPDGTLVCGTSSGDAIIIKIVNLSMGFTVITPVRLWLYEREMDYGYNYFEPPPVGDAPSLNAIPGEANIFEKIMRSSLNGTIDRHDFESTGGEINIPGKWDDNITALCLWCGKRFIVDNQILNTIYRDGDVPATEMEIRRNAIEREIKMETSLRPSQITDISIPDSAYNDPRLLSKCPVCEKPLRFNPFIVDNK